jgi:monoterpene epsilon-lactone hydrolase
MGYLRLASHAVSSTVRAVVRRTTRGPRLPNWNPSLESAVAFTRSALEVAIRMDPKHTRRVVNMGLMGLGGSAAHKQVTFRKEVLGGVPSYCVEPAAGSTGGVLLYLHGAGYVAGDPARSHREIVSRLTLASGCRTWAVDYRLAPEHPFPAAVEDAVDAYEALLRGGVDPCRIVVSGESAGGGLSLALLLRLRDAGRPLPAAAALISPWVDLTVTGTTFDTNADTCWAVREVPECWSAQYRAGEDPRNPLVSPLYADLRGLPSLLIHAGGAETLLDEITRFADAAKAARLSVAYEVYEGMPHVWHFFAPFVPEARQALEAVGSFVQAKVAGDLTRP